MVIPRRFKQHRETTMERRGASPSACSTAYGIPYWRIKKAIREGALVAHGVGRKSILLFSDVEQWIKSHPATSSSRPKQQDVCHGVE
jgi:hypothetical protein